jgi:hypothetical protein
MSCIDNNISGGIQGIVFTLGCIDNHISGGIQGNLQLRVKRFPWIPPLILLLMELRVKRFPWIPPLILLSIQLNLFTLS